MIGVIGWVSNNMSTGQLVGKWSPSLSRGSMSYTDPSFQGVITLLKEAAFVSGYFELINCARGGAGVDDLAYWDVLFTVFV